LIYQDNQDITRSLKNCDWYCNGKKENGSNEAISSTLWRYLIWRQGTLYRDTLSSRFHLIRCYCQLARHSQRSPLRRRCVRNLPWNKTQVPLRANIRENTWRNIRGGRINPCNIPLINQMNNDPLSEILQRYFIHRSPTLSKIHRASKIHFDVVMGNSCAY